MDLAFSRRSLSTVVESPRQGLPSSGAGSEQDEQVGEGQGPFISHTDQGRSGPKAPTRNGPKPHRMRNTSEVQAATGCSGTSEKRSIPQSEEAESKVTNLLSDPADDLDDEYEASSVLAPPVIPSNSGQDNMSDSEYIPSDSASSTLDESDEDSAFDVDLTEGMSVHSAGLSPRGLDREIPHGLSYPFKNAEQQDPRADESMESQSQIPWGGGRVSPDTSAPHPLQSPPAFDIWQAGNESDLELSRTSTAASSWIDGPPELLEAPDQQPSASRASNISQIYPSPYPRPSWIPGATPTNIDFSDRADDSLQHDSHRSTTPERYTPISSPTSTQPPFPTIDYTLYQSHPIYTSTREVPSHASRSRVRPVKVDRATKPVRDSPSPSLLIQTTWSRRSEDTPSPAHTPVLPPVPDPVQLTGQPPRPPSESPMSEVGAQSVNRNKTPYLPTQASFPADSDGYDTDLEYDEVEFVNKYENEKDDEPGVGAKIYEQACLDLRTAPLRYVIDHMTNCSMDLSNRSLGPKAIKPLCKALVKNKRIRQLDVSGNGMGEIGARYISEALKHNSTISDLDLSHNELGTGGALYLAEMFRFNGALERLNLSYNNFTEESGHYFAIGIEINALLHELDLSHNELREDGAMYIGRALGEDSSLQRLDLSWNHIRLKGAVAICTGLRTNFSLTHLNISWNGFGYEGALGLASLLKFNTTLVEIDASHNRINWKGALLLARGLGNNTTLHTIRLGGNPLTTTGYNDIIDALAGNRESGLRLLDLEGIPVITEFEMVASTIRAERHLEIIHGGIVATHDVLGQRHDEIVDPLQRVINYMRENEIRPTELYKTFDKSKSNKHISDKEFSSRIHTSGISFQMYEMRDLLEQINAGGGENSTSKAIDYQKLAGSIKLKIEMERLKKIKVREEEKKLDMYHKDILRTKLPEVPEGDAAAVTLETALTSRSQPENKIPRPLLLKKASAMSLCKPAGTSLIKKKKKKRKKKK